MISALKKVIVAIYSDYNAKLEQAQLVYDYANQSSDVSYEDFYKVRDIRDAIKAEMEEYAQYYNSLDDIRASDSEIKYHNEVSIAYNNTFVTSARDFIPCVVIKNDQEHDLAIIQLKDKKTPSEKYVFPIEEDPLETYSWKDKIEQKSKRIKTVNCSCQVLISVQH